MGKLKMLILLLLCVTGFTHQAMAQFERIETYEPIRSNTLTNKLGEFVASADIYKDYVEISFYERTIHKNMTFYLTISEYKQMSNILNDYSIKDKELFTLDVNNGRVFIRFIEKFNYIQSHIYLRYKDEMRYFPRLNRYEYSKLFSPIETLVK